MVTQEREQFVSTCMAYLAAASQDFEKNTLIVERCLIILRVTKFRGNLLILYRHFWMSLRLRLEHVVLGTKGTQ